MDQVKVDTLKSALSAVTYNELVAAMIAAQENHKRIKDEAAEAWEEVCVITRQVIPERFDRDQIQNITVILPDGSKKQLLVIPQVSVKTPEENRMQLRVWLREHDASEIISETVNASTLAAYVRAQMKLGEAYPADLCDVSVYDTASLRKAS